MASGQQVRGGNQLSDKEKAAVDEAVKEAAQNYLASNKNAKADQEQLVLVTGVMRNAQHRALTLNKTHEWMGHFLAEPTKTMGKSGAFVHQGATLPGHLPVVVGSKGAILYTTFDFAYPPLGYILAWYKPDNSNGMNKVYVEAGDSGRLMKMEWSEIQQKLDASEDVSRYWDNDTGAAIAARIVDHGDNVALLGCTFDRFGG